MSFYQMICYIGVGSNIGNRLRYIENAIALLKTTEGIKIIKVSPVHQSKACGGPKGQGDYLNLVLKINSTLLPVKLLKALKDIEVRVGRKPRSRRWAEREIDLDILFYGQLIVKQKCVEIPHPRLAERYFVLKPLSVIAPRFKHPLFGKRISELLKSLK